MDLWRMALDLATEARDDIDRLGIHMTPDQKLATAQIYATLAVAQALAGDESAALAVAQELAGDEPAARPSRGRRGDAASARG